MLMKSIAAMAVKWTTKSAQNKHLCRSSKNKRIIVNKRILYWFASISGRLKYPCLFNDMVLDEKEIKGAASHSLALCGKHSYSDKEYIRDISGFMSRRRTFYLLSGLYGDPVRLQHDNMECIGLENRHTGWQITSHKKLNRCNQLALIRKSTR